LEVQRRVRATLQQSARRRISPAQALQRLDAAVPLREQQTATVFYGVLIPHRAGALLVYTNAGHPAPLLFRPDGGLSQLRGGRSAALGSTETERTDAAVCIPCGSIVLLRSGGSSMSADSAVEAQRGRWEEIFAGVHPAEPDLEELCQQAVDAIDLEIPDDDVTLMAVAVTEPTAGRAAGTRARPPATLGVR